VLDSFTEIAVTKSRQSLQLIVSVWNSSNVMERTNVLQGHYIIKVVSRSKQQGRNGWIQLGISQLSWINLKKHSKRNATSLVKE